MVCFLKFIAMPPNWLRILFYYRRLWSTWLYMVIVLKILNTSCPKGRDKKCRPRSDCLWWSSLIRVFPVCNFDNHFVSSSLDNQHFVWEQSEKSVQNFKTLNVVYCNKWFMSKAHWLDSQHLHEQNTDWEPCNSLDSILVQCNPFIKLCLGQ